MSEGKRDRHLRRAPLPRGVKPEPRPSLSDEQREEMVRAATVIDSLRRELNAMRELVGVLAFRLGADKMPLSVTGEQREEATQSGALVLGYDKAADILYLRVCSTETKDEAVEQIKALVRETAEGTLQ